MRSAKASRQGASAQRLQEGVVRMVHNGRWSARVVRRPVSADALFEVSRSMALHPVAAQVLAARIPDHAERLALPSLSDLDAPDLLPDAERAAERIVVAIITREPIALVTDADVDGISGHAVLFEALTRHFGHPVDLVRSYIGHKLIDGYGLSDGVLRQVLDGDPLPALVITADCGSSDEARIAKLAAAGVDVLVTDHHELPADGPPASAFATVSPARHDSRYQDYRVAGVMVAWLLMAQVRRVLVRVGHLSADAPTLRDLLDFVALGTVADCVSLATSVNNRAVVRAGLQLVAQGRRPCWRAARRFLGDTPTLSARDLAFGIGPRINARSRVNEPMAGLRYLLSPSDSEATRWLDVLDQENATRKDIEKELTETAFALAEKQVAAGATGLALFLEDGHPGVHGIVASRVVERFGRPAVCLSPHAQDAELVTGSARGIPGIHIRDALEEIQQASGGILVKFGGHEGAGGLTLPADGVTQFQGLFDGVTAAVLHGIDLAPVAWSDGPLPVDTITFDLVDALAALEPYGREFADPVFEVSLKVAKCRPVGELGNHLQLTLQGGAQIFQAIWFNAATPGEPAPAIALGVEQVFLVTPGRNWFNGRCSLQLQVKGMVLEE